MSDGNTETENLLELELDGRLDLVDLAAEVFVVRHGGREFTSLGQTGAEQTRNLLDEGLGSKEGVVLLGELLDELLVLYYQYGSLSTIGHADPLKWARKQVEEY